MRTAVVSCLHEWKTVLSFLLRCRTQKSHTTSEKQLCLFPGQQSSRHTFVLIWQRSRKEGWLRCVCTLRALRHNTPTIAQIHTHAHTPRQGGLGRLREVERSKGGRFGGCFFANCTARLLSPGKPDQPFSRMSQRKRSFTFGAYGGWDKHGLFCSVGGVCQLWRSGGVNAPVASWCARVRVCHPGWGRTDKVKWLSWGWIHIQELTIAIFLTLL